MISVCHWCGVRLREKETREGRTIVNCHACAHSLVVLDARGVAVEPHVHLQQSAGQVRVWRGAKAGGLARGGRRLVAPRVWGLLSLALATILVATEIVRFAMDGTVDFILLAIGGFYGLRGLSVGRDSDLVFGPDGVLRRGRRSTPRAVADVFVITREGSTALPHYAAWRDKNGRTRRLAPFTERAAAAAAVRAIRDAVGLPLEPVPPSPRRHAGLVAIASS